jgi:L-ascorbate metabolism protein UlaG (beta-lactamase superfamily)
MQSGPRLARWLLLIFLAILLGAAAPGGAAALRNAVSVTAITLDGFAISWGDRRILIDALHRAAAYGVTPAIETAMREALPPFDADLVLVTHEHIDHFIADVVADNLRANPKAVLVSSPVVIDAVRAIFPELEEGRFVALSPTLDRKVQITVAGVRIEAFNSPHGIPAVLNLAFLLDLGGHLFFHPGDLVGMTTDGSDPSTRLFDLGGQSLDLAFVPYWFLSEPSCHGFVRREMAARYLIPMHGSPRKLEAMLHRVASPSFPNLVFFENVLDTWVLPERDRP